MNKVYSGIGSRQITPEGAKLARFFAKELDSKGYTLRSGGAGGADALFEENHTGTKEIFLPWEGFNNNPSKLLHISKEAEDMAVKYYPSQEGLRNSSPGVLKLMARNCYQVLGKNLDDPTDFIVCWTPSENHGGTSQALRIAKDKGIRFYNLADPRHVTQLLEFLD